MSPILFFLSAFLAVSPQLVPLPICLMYPLSPVFPPITLRLSLLMFWLFTFQDYIVPSLSSPWLSLWWEFQPHRGNQIKEQTCRLCQESFLQRPFGGPCHPTELKLGPFSSLWFYLKEKKKPKQSCWEKFPKWNLRPRRQGKKAFL